MNTRLYYILAASAAALLALNSPVQAQQSPSAGQSIGRDTSIKEGSKEHKQLQISDGVNSIRKDTATQTLHPGAADAALMRQEMMRGAYGGGGAGFPLKQ